MLTGSVGGGEHVAGDLAAPCLDRGLRERDDRHPVVGADLASGVREAGQPSGGNVEVGHVLERLVCLVAQTLAA